MEAWEATFFQSINHRGGIVMDLEGFAFAGFLADEEKRRAAKKALEEKQKLKAEYDKWCKDHGIPPPPDKVD